MMIFNPFLLIIYVVFSVMVAFFGRNRSIGFSGVLTFSLLVSPIIVALVLLVSAPRTAKNSV